MKRRSHVQSPDSDWMENVFAGLLALTEDGSIVWEIYPRLPGAMRTTYRGESFWLWREQLLIDEETQLQLQGEAARKLSELVGAEYERQTVEHIQKLVDRKQRRREQIDAALALVVEAAESQ